jgi:hypothetical protein
MKKTVEQIYFIADNKNEAWDMQDWAVNWMDDNESLNMTLEAAEFSFAEHADVFFPELEKQSTGKSRNTVIYKYLKEAATYAAECRAQRKIVVNPQTPSSSLNTSAPGPGKQVKIKAAHAKNKEEDAKEDATKEMIVFRDQKEAAAVLWKFATIKLKKWTGDELVQQVHEYFSFDSKRVTQSYLAYQAENLLKYMNRTVDEKKDFSKTQLYKDLSTVTISSRIAGKMAELALIPRDMATWDSLAGELGPHPSADNDIEDEEEDDDSEEDKDEETQDHIPSSMLRPRLGTSIKRYTRNLDTLPTSDHPRLGSKRKKRDDDEASQTSQTHDTENQNLSLRWKEGSDMDFVPTVLKSIPIDPNAIDEDGNWQCNQPDCLHVVYAARTDLGQELLKMHMEDHENGDVLPDMDPEMDVLMREKQATRMPVR